MRKTILLTWATGYIGSHTAVEFIEAGHEVIIVDNLANSDADSLKGVETITWVLPQFYECDLRDGEKLEEVFKKHNFDCVIHFAGLKAVGESCEKPLEYFDNNIVGTLRLFECMEKYNVWKLIFSSSATVYDPVNFELWIWVSESWTTGETTNPYGTTKYLIERIMRDLAAFSEIQIANLRYFNPIWAHPSWEIGEYPDDYPNNLLPYVMKVACGELPHLNVFGEDYNTPDGTWVRDYIDVCDLSKAHFKAYLSLEWVSGGNIEHYNLWTGRGTSVLELIKIASQITWSEIDYKIIQRRAWDIGQVFCDPKKAEEKLWWIANTPTDESVKNSYQFSKKISWS